jgi:hypothetical protein
LFISCPYYFISCWRKKAIIFSWVLALFDQMMQFGFEFAA